MERCHLCDVSTQGWDVRGPVSRIWEGERDLERTLEGKDSVRRPPYLLPLHPRLAPTQAPPVECPSVLWYLNAFIGNSCGFRHDTMVTRKSGFNALSATRLHSRHMMAHRFPGCY